MNWRTPFINRKPASNFHHAIRLAEAINRPLNVFVTLNFGHTACLPGDAAKAFQQLRRKFGKWVTRPPARSNHEHAPATFVWVLEQPSHRDGLHSHWLVHVPAKRLRDFETKLPQWVRSVAGDVSDQRAIDVRSVANPRGPGVYMLKGMHPVWAAHFDIRHEPQGLIEGRRSGFTKNLGPTQKRYLRACGKYPKARPWVKGMYSPKTPGLATHADSHSGVRV